MVRDFARARWKPQAQEWDREERFRGKWCSTWALGLLGMTVPEELGGSALDTVSVACVVEEIARWDGSLALTVASHNGLGTSHLLRFGSDELRKRYIPEIAAGRKLAAWGLTEPGSGSDAAGMRSTAVRKDKGWVLNGSKMFITQGSVGDVFVVLALNDPEKRQKGVTAFLLDKGMKGFSQRPLHGKLGMRSSDTAELVMEDVYVEDWRRIGEVGGACRHPEDRQGPHHHRRLERGSAGAPWRSVAYSRSGGWQAHRGLPGAALDDGGHGHGAGRSAPWCSARAPGGRGEPLHARGGDGQTVRERGRLPRGGAGCADPWLRIHQGVPGGTHLPGRSHHRRGTSEVRR
jgi:hypothetical protein